MTIVLPIDDTGQEADTSPPYLSAAERSETSSVYHAIVTRLNDRWRVIDSCERHPYRQWILQQRSKSETTQYPWTARSFCQTRIVLLRCIREKADAIDPAVLDIIKQLPDRID